MLLAPTLGFVGVSYGDDSPERYTHCERPSTCLAASWDGNLTLPRASGKDDFIKLPPAMQLTLEDAVEYVADDEYVEVTPSAVRMGKRPKQGRGRK